MGSHPWWKVDVQVGLAAHLWLGMWLWYAFLNVEKWKFRACFEHIWSIFIFNNSQWVFMCLPLPMEAKFLTPRLVFFQFFTPNSWKVRWRTVEASASMISAWWKSWFLFPWRWPMAWAIHMKLFLTLEKFPYHLWHRVTQDEERLTLLGWGRFFHGTASLSACSEHQWHRLSTLGAMGKTTSEPPGHLTHQLFTTGGSLWLHTNCLMVTTNY